MTINPSINENIQCICYSKIRNSLAYEDVEKMFFASIIDNPRTETYQPIVGALSDSVSKTIRTSNLFFKVNVGDKIRIPQFQSDYIVASISLDMAGHRNVLGIGGYSPLAIQDRFPKVIQLK